MSAEIMTIKELAEYLGMLYQDLIKTKAVKTGEKLPPVLPIVLYNGTSRWKSAPLDIKDSIAKVPRGLEKYLPQLRYLLIDEGRYSNHELENIKSLVAALFKLERQQTPEEVRNIVATLVEWLKAPEQQSLRRAFTVWLGRVLLPTRYPNESIPEFHDLQEVHAMLSETVKAWPAQWMAKGKIEDALNMLEDDLPIEKICKYTGLPREQIEKLAADKNKVSEPVTKYKAPHKPKAAKPRSK